MAAAAHSHQGHGVVAQIVPITAPAEQFHQQFTGAPKASPAPTDPSWSEWGVRADGTVRRVLDKALSATEKYIGLWFDHPVPMAAFHLVMFGSVYLGLRWVSHRWPSAPGLGLTGRLAGGSRNVADTLRSGRDVVDIVRNFRRREAGAAGGVDWQPQAFYSDHGEQD